MSTRAIIIPGDSNMAAGTVKFFNMNKGFGFIAPEQGGKDVFVHISALERSGLTSLADGQKVSFDLERDRQGRDAATNLKSA
jgi:CspA family cold shock protein